MKSQQLLKKKLWKSFVPLLIKSEKKKKKRNRAYHKLPKQLFAVPASWVMYLKIAPEEAQLNCILPIVQEIKIQKEKCTS